MGKKHPLHRPWTVRLTARYHRERDERIARAYELIVPIVSQLPQSKSKAEPLYDTLLTVRSLRTRVQ